MPKKLYIYDIDSFQDRWQADGRFSSDDADIVTLPVGNMKDVLDGLDKLLAQGAVFDRLLFQTHGNFGRIWFGDDKILPYVWTDSFANRNYDKLFPNYSRVYFDGCNVAEGAFGEDFLRAAGRVFLKGMGGEVFGWTEGGFGFPGWTPYFGGHTVHFAGDLVRIKFDHMNPNGTLVPEPRVPRYTGFTILRRH